MSDFHEIRQAVLACVSRAAGSFAAGSTNFVDTAINNAIIYAQRNRDFEWNKGLVTVDCNPRGSILSAKDEFGKAVKIKRIVKAFGKDNPGIDYHKSIPYISRTSQITDDTDRENRGYAVTCPRVVHDGQLVYFSPVPTDPYTLYLYAVKWLPRLVKNEDTNFILEYGYDFVLYRSIVELNHFIKEDERFPVSKTLLNEAWQSFVDWDANLISPTETEIEL